MKSAVRRRDADPGAGSRPMIAGAASSDDSRPSRAGTGAAPALRIVIVDDHAVVRSGCRRLLELDPALRVVAEFEDGDSAYGWLVANSADILVLDLGMPGRGGLSLLERLRQRVPRLRILVFTMHESEELAAQALRLGACGYIVKSDPPEALAEAVRDVAAGSIALSSGVAGALGRHDDSGHAGLSSREFTIFLRLAAGVAIEDIAAEFSLSPKTISNYQTAIRVKTGLATSLDMHRYAVARGLLGSTIETRRAASAPAS